MHTVQFFIMARQDLAKAIISHCMYLFMYFNVFRAISSNYQPSLLLNMKLREMLKK